MANGHVHSVYLENGKYHHLFNLLFMTYQEIEMMNLLLNGKPIPQDKLVIINSIKKSVEEMVNKAVVKDHQPVQERIEYDEQGGHDDDVSS